MKSYTVQRKSKLFCFAHRIFSPSRALTCPKLVYHKTPLEECWFYLKIKIIFNIILNGTESSKKEEFFFNLWKLKDSLNIFGNFGGHFWLLYYNYWDEWGVSDINGQEASGWEVGQFQEQRTDPWLPNSWQPYKGKTYL